MVVAALAVALAIPCDLRLSFGRRWGRPPGQSHVQLVVRNVDRDLPCRVTGWPDVELIGPVDPANGADYTLPRQVGRRATFTLRPGHAAHAVLTWLPRGDPSNPRWVPGYVRVVVRTAAGPSFPLVLPWRFGTVLRQDAATHPGTYVGPLRPGSR